MTPINNTTQDSTQLVQEGPIRVLPNEIMECILFRTNESESTTLVNHNWNVLSLPATKEAYKYDLKQAIRLHIETLCPFTFAGCIGELAEILDLHQFLADCVTTCGQAKRLFLTGQGLVIGSLSNLPKEA